MKGNSSRIWRFTLNSISWIPKHTKVLIILIHKIWKSDETISPPVPLQGALNHRNYNITAAIFYETRHYYTIVRQPNSDFYFKYDIKSGNKVNPNILETARFTKHCVLRFYEQNLDILVIFGLFSKLFFFFPQ